MVFAANPPMWQDLYGEPDTGSMVSPATPEEFEAMLKDWDESGFAPIVAGD